MTTLKENQTVSQEPITGEKFGDLLTKNANVKRAFEAAMKCVAKEHMRPMLEGVHYDENGTLVATDSMKLIRIENAWIKGCDPFTVTYRKKAYERIEGNYPQTDRLLPSADDAKATFAFDVDDPILRALLKMTIELLKGEQNPTTIFQYDDGAVTIKPQAHPVVTKGLTLRYKQEMINGKGEAFTIALNAKFLLNILDAFKKLKIQRVTLHYFAKLRPVLFTAVEHDSYATQAILLPIRLY